MNSPAKTLVADQSVEVSVKKRPVDPRPIFLAMQGGGAKGVAHVGALKAIEKFHYDIRGVSGTSAGSMVAALVSVGYKADEMVNFETREHLFTRSAEGLGFHQPIDIFPGTFWRKLKICRRIGAFFGYGHKPVPACPEPELSDADSLKRDRQKLDANKAERKKLEDLLIAASAKRCASRRAPPVTPLGKFMSVAAKAITTVLVTFGLSVRLSANLTWFFIYYCIPFGFVTFSVGAAIKNGPVITALIVSAVIVNGYLLVRQLLRWGWRFVGGLNTVGNVSLLIDRALTQKLAERGYVKEGGGITFGDLKRARERKVPVDTIPLKIVATNVAYECLELFCEDRTPDVKIGDAVAASVCLPFVFEPWNLTFYRHTETKTELIEGQFLDGGLVSNLPAWPFDEERVLSPSIGTIALSLESDVKIGKHWTSAVLGTVVNGSSMIHTRAAGSTLKIPLTPSMNMMQFDASAEDVWDVVSKTASAVEFRLAEELDTRAALQAAAKAMHGLFHSFVMDGVAEWFELVRNPRVRVAIVAERGGSMNSLSTVFTHGYKPSDVDRAVTRAASSWIFEKALRTNKPQIHFLDTRLPGDDVYQKEHIWAKARWIACFPMILPNPQSEMSGRRIRRFMLVVDSNMPFDESNPLIEDFKDLFVSHASVEVLQYFEKHDLLDSVQGDNTWI
ncbi:patatin-like phospholipase family protein [Pseudomonas coleopterorum]|uniref:patatin-like phospholipase family protein n=1 Tax=Pseudomonas coleopterorum TaxID=1605838 RepID=UPI002A69B277|nr:patatin-like phospholipase family protein [Pseudomonas coleopterorum]MDY1019484.1 patatin-like phospholipase family protein [Pseudomonas coleopterorum]